LENQKTEGVREMSEYDLKKSEKIGQLYPVLVDAEGNIIDGFHRLKADPNWRRERIKEVDTQEKLLVARCVSNWHRRQVEREEKEEWINGLARIYERQGLKVKSETGSEHKNEIKDKIAEVTGLDGDTVNGYLDAEFKQSDILRPVAQPYLPASERIEHSLGKEYVERHRQEVLAEEKPKLEKQIKKELLKNPEFVREAIEKAPEVVPTLPKRTIERAKKLVEPKEMVVQEGINYTVGEYECPHCKKHYLIRCDGKHDWVE
jgi:hypothetical protein